MTREELTQQIEQAQGRVGQLRGDLRDAEKRLAALRVQLAELDHGVKVGDRVQYKRDGQVRFGYVCGISPGFPLPWYTVHPEKKDGSPAVSTTTVYNDVTLAPKEAP